MGENNVGALTIELRTQMAQFANDMGQATRTVQTTAAAMEREFRVSSQAAKQHIQLLSESIGIGLPREVRKMMVEIPGVASAINAAFSVLGPIAFATIIVEKILPAIKKMYDYFTDVKAIQEKLAADTALAKSMRELTIEAQKIEEVYEKIGQSARESAQDEWRKNAALQQGLEIRLATLRVLLASEEATAKETVKQRAMYTGSGMIGGAVVASPEALAAQERIPALSDAIKVLAQQTENLHAKFQETFKAYSVDVRKAAEDTAVAENKIAEAGAKAQQHLAELLMKATGGVRGKGTAAQGSISQSDLGIGDLPIFGKGIGAGLAGDVGQNLKDQAGWYDATRTAAERYQIEVAKLNATFANNESSDTYQRALAKIKDHYTETSHVQRQLAALTADLLTQAITGTRGWADAVKGLLGNIVSLIAQTLILRIVSGFASAMSPALGNIFGSLAGGFGSGKAAGGNVFAGVSYPVGERGPEMFTPGVSGVITPNSGAPEVTLIVNNNSSAQVDAQISKPRIDGKKVIITAVLEDIANNGPLRQVLASR